MTTLAAERPSRIDPRRAYGQVSRGAGLPDQVLSAPNNWTDRAATLALIRQVDEVALLMPVTE